jgi:hypothetical protein
MFSRVEYINEAKMFGETAYKFTERKRCAYTGK